jgi:hypothetical protein
MLATLLKLTYASIYVTDIFVLAAFSSKNFLSDIFSFFPKVYFFYCSAIFISLTQILQPLQFSLLPFI